MRDKDLGHLYAFGFEGRGYMEGSNRGFCHCGRHCLVSDQYRYQDINGIVHGREVCEMPTDPGILIGIRGLEQLARFAAGASPGWNYADHALFGFVERDDIHLMPNDEPNYPNSAKFYRCLDLIKSGLSPTSTELAELGV